VTNLYKDIYEMVVVAKRFRTYVFSRYLGFSRKEVHCSSGNNHVPEDKEMSFKEKEFKLP
jgi:hypothetical protein